jgi:uncharacterized cupin superfamily protein
MGKRIDLNSVPVSTGSKYPSPFDAPCAARARQRLGDAARLTDFGVNRLRLPAGAWSSQRHWQILRAGDCAGFKAGVHDGHHLQNRSDREAVLLEIGSRKTEEDEGDYPDIDLRFLKGRAGYFHKDGTPYHSKGSHKKNGRHNEQSQ